jgi:hypothetical protein
MAAEQGVCWQAYETAVDWAVSILSRLLTQNVGFCGCGCGLVVVVDAGMGLLTPGAASAVLVRTQRCATSSSCSHSWRGESGMKFTSVLM